MVYSTGYALVTGQPLSQSSTGSARPAVIPTCLTPAQIDEILEAQSGFPYRVQVISRFKPPSDQAIDLQRRILKELDKIFTKHGKAKNFEQAVLNDFAAYLNKQHKGIGLVATQCWENQLKTAFTEANNALSSNRRSTATLTTMSSVVISSAVQRIDQEFRKKIGVYISDKEVIKILSDELCIILEKNKRMASFAAAVQHDFEEFLMQQPAMDEGDMLGVIEDLKSAMKVGLNKKEEKAIAAEMTTAPMLAIALPVPIPSSSLAPQTGPTVIQRIQAVFTKVWSLILSFFANLVKRFQE